MGNYEPCPYNPIMRQMDEKAGLQRCGHGKPVCTEDGKWYMVYLCGRTIGKGYTVLGRETALDPITWTADGWPIVNHLKGPSVLQTPPIQATAEALLAHSTANERVAHIPVFQNGLPKDFMTPRPPERDGIRIREGHLILKASAYPLSDVRARDILMRRQSAFCFRAEAEFTAPVLTEGQEAGITCYYDENTWVCFFLSRNRETYFLQIREHIGKENIDHTIEKLRDPAGGRFMLGVETAYLERRFYYAAAGEDAKTFEKLSDMYYLSDEGISMGKRFTGAMVGMYGYAKEKPLFIEFTDFRYQER